MCLAWEESAGVKWWRNGCKNKGVMEVSKIFCYGAVVPLTFQYGRKRSVSFPSHYQPFRYAYSLHCRPIYHLKVTFIYGSHVTRTKHTLIISWLRQYHFPREISSLSSLEDNWHSHKYISDCYNNFVFGLYILNATSQYTILKSQEGLLQLYSLVTAL